jgi:hypothetical protein
LLLGQRLDELARSRLYYSDIDFVFLINVFNELVDFPVIFKTIHVSKVVSKWNNNIFIVLLSICNFLYVIDKAVDLVVKVVALNLSVRLEW